jgi:putative lumazine-binding protein
MKNEEQFIMQTIKFYADGGTYGDAGLVATAFHPSATMKFIKDGTLVDVPIDNYLSDYIKPGRIHERTATIDYINICGSAAQVKLTLDYAQHQFIDFFNLLKIDGRWLIVSKIFFRNNK